MTHNRFNYALGAVLFLVLTILVPKVEAYSVVTGTLQATVVRPERIIIPAVGVNADIIDIGVTPQNNLDVPPNFVQAGWYKYGPIPGAQGNAVIDGHVDNGGSTPGPFKNLKNVRIGDLISVKLNNDTYQTFRIASTSVVDYKKFPSESVFRGGSDSVLKIITCHGTFLPLADTYNQRLIVTAVKV